MDIDYTEEKTLLKLAPGACVWKKKPDATLGGPFLVVRDYDDKLRLAHLYSGEMDDIQPEYQFQEAFFYLKKGRMPVQED